jgi:hypothetical protein
MPPKQSEGSWEEYRLLHIQTLEWLTKEVRRMSDELLVVKVKIGIVAALGGGIAGAVGAIITALVLNWLKIGKP